MTVRVLDQDLLTELERRLSDQDVLAIGSAAPALAEAEMDATLATIGLAVPIEAHVLWQWHDGALHHDRRGAAELAPSRNWLSLVESLTLREQILEMNTDDPEVAETVWSSRWLPVIDSVPMVGLDIGVGHESPCSVWLQDLQGPPVLELASLGDLVALWIEALNRGVWLWDREDGAWDVGHAALSSWPAAKNGAVYTTRRDLQRSPAPTSSPAAIRASAQTPRGSVPDRGAERTMAPGAGHLLDHDDRLRRGGVRPSPVGQRVLIIITIPHDP
jgi:hypothetical protein